MGSKIKNYGVQQNSLPSHKKLHKYIFSVLVFSAGAAAGFGLSGLWGWYRAVDASELMRINSLEYAFINPLLECNVPGNSLDAKKQNFEKELERFIRKLKNEEELNIGSVYFRDLNNGPTFGINEDEGYIPASLLKLPVAMVYYHLANSNPSILKETIAFKTPVVLPENGKQLIAPKIELEVGKEYAIEDLIYRSLVYSDNEAITLLVNRMPTQEIYDLYSLVGVDASAFEKENGTLSVKNYSAFFRVLFNASYINRSGSEKILKMLSEVDFKDALVAGVPKNTVVSHKFGESGSLTGEHQLHDCGIVYYPDHPYLLCVMSRGKTTVELSKAIKHISQFVYEKIASQY